MVTDWIKMRTDLYRDPKVLLITDILMDPDGDLSRYVNQNCQREMSITRNVTRNASVGALLSVWGVLRHRGKRIDDDLFCKGMRLNNIDDIADLPGFGVAMEVAGWVHESTKGLLLKNFFSDYNVDPEQDSRKKAAERQRLYRQRQKQKKEENSNVTSDVTLCVTRDTREEKRREVHIHEKTKTKTGLPADFSVSDRVKAWAGKKGFKSLDRHLENFCTQARARGYKYVSWDDAFMTAIRDDWAKIRNGEHSYSRGTV